MTILVFALFVVMIVVGVTIWTQVREQVREKEESSGQPDSGTPSAHSVSDPGVSGVVPAKGPPSAGQGEEALKARLADMPTESLQSMLDMGATLKPGAEDLIKDELDRRRESE